MYLNAQDSLFQTLLHKSQCVVNATVVSISGKIRHEDGYVRYTVVFKVTQKFKGEPGVGDFVSVEIVDNAQGLGGRDSATQEEKHNLIQIGSSLVLCLSAIGNETFGQRPSYRPTDRMLGLLPASPSLILYLQANYKTEKK